MQYDEFVGRVHNRAQLASTGEAVKAIRATLQTLGERLFGDEADHVAAQLPEEIGTYLTMIEDDERESFDLEEFFLRVAAKEPVDLPTATYHARVVMEVLQEAITAGELEDLRAQLPEDYKPLFEAGSKGEMDTP
jgi:uncharacterized protein (DUF2267 family)